MITSAEKSTGYDIQLTGTFLDTNAQMKAASFKEDYIAIIARELLKGLEYLHGEGKLHRGNRKS